MTAASPRPPSRQVHRRAIGWWTLRAVLVALPATVAPAVAAVFLPDAQGPLFAAAAVLAVLALAYVLVEPRWRYRVHRWEVTEDAVYTAAGWAWREWRAAPMSRVQTVDTERGPLEQLFGLASVTVTTASAAGAVRIGGLEYDEARALADRLTVHAQLVQGDAA